jgi:hypothetical protein
MQCAFLGYSGFHKGYKYLDISTGRLYISRDVTFDESVCPFSQLHPNAGALLRSEIQLLPCVLRNPTILDQENEIRHDHMSVSANFFWMIVHRSHLLQEIMLISANLALDPMLMSLLVNLVLDPMLLLPPANLSLPRDPLLWCLLVRGLARV